MNIKYTLFVFCIVWVSVLRRIKDYCFLRNDNDEISLLVDTLLPEQIERLEIESKSSVIRLFTNNLVSVSIQLSHQHLITMKELKSRDLCLVSSFLPEVNKGIILPINWR
ncbi:hypothetical protein EAY39_10800 [Vibrio anguillarum]|nr:hypothetical protein [Vibrio anguillarum]MBF4341271.1 hypothetical protein [Vibrio anguillarum]